MGQKERLAGGQGEVVVVVVVGLGGLLLLRTPHVPGTVKSTLQTASLFTIMVPLGKSSFLTRLTLKIVDSSFLRLYVFYLPHLFQLRGDFRSAPFHPPFQTEYVSLPLSLGLYSGSFAMTGSLFTKLCAGGFSPCTT